MSKRVVKSNDARWILLVTEHEGQWPMPYFYMDKKERDAVFKRFVETGEFTYSDMSMRGDRTMKPVSMYKAHSARSAHWITDWR